MTKYFSRVATEPYDGLPSPSTERYRGSDELGSPSYITRLQYY